MTASAIARPAGVLGAVRLHLAARVADILRGSDGGPYQRRKQSHNLLTQNEEIMGKGDLRSRRGKIYNGSHGKTRPGRAPKKEAAPAQAPVSRPASGGRSK